MAEGTLTFFSKKPIECPVCENKIYREEMRTGRGRQIAGRLTNELRRHFEPSKQYGAVYPLLYPVTVCPRCYYAAYPEDFETVPPHVVEILAKETDARLDSLGGLLTPLDFAAERGLREGVASYLLAAMCYEHFPSSSSPWFKSGVSQLRAAWLCSDLHRQFPAENFDYLSIVLYRKARYYYSRAVQGEQDGSQPLSGARSLGPDLDKNYGYDGVLYISGLLEYRYGPRADSGQRRKALENAKRTIARIFGMGKASKNKPAAILDNARETYDAIARELGLADADPEQEEVE